MLIAFQATSQVILHNGHSHNDYCHDRPLLDALEYGFRSIEVDIHPYNDLLKVRHTKAKLKKAPTLDQLYLNKLDSIISFNEGTVYPNDSAVLILMVDLKSKKEEALMLLAEKLDKLNFPLYSYSKSGDIWGPVRVVLSGNPPNDILEKLKRPYFFIDGRFGNQYSAKLKPMICRVSANYSLVKRNESPQAYLETLVRTTKKYGRNLRFWATKDNENTWRALDKAGLDWISVDDLKRFYVYKKSIGHGLPNALKN